MTFWYRCLPSCPWKQISAQHYLFFIGCMADHPRLMEHVTVAVSTVCR
jgi:hypothetical protein